MDSFKHACEPGRSLMLWRCEEGVRSQLTGIVGGYEQPHVGAGNWTKVLWKGSQCSRPLSHLSSPQFFNSCSCCVFYAVLLQAFTVVWWADCKKSSSQGPDSFLLVPYYSGAFILESHKVACDGGKRMLGFCLFVFSQYSRLVKFSVSVLTRMWI